MADINAVINLANNFTPVLNNMISALSLTVSAVENVGQSMNSIDTTRVEAARNAINQLEMSAQSLQNTMANVGPVTGSVRFANEVSAVNQQFQRIFEVQGKITQRAHEVDILDPLARHDIELVEDRVYDLFNQIKRFENNPFNINTESAVRALEQFRVKASAEISQIQTEMQNAMQAGNLESIIQSRRRMNEIISSTQKQLNDLNAKWQGNNFQIFTNTGIARFNREVADANSRMEELSRTQARVSSMAASCDVLPPDAAADVFNLKNKVTELFGVIRDNSSKAFQIDPEGASAQVERTRQQLSQLQSQYQDFIIAIQSGDASRIQSTFLVLNENLNGMTQQARDFRDNLDQAANALGKWQTNDFKVFTNSGAARFKQEIRDAAAMMGKLQTAQAEVKQRAETTNILPPQAITDITSIAQRLEVVQAKVQKISAHPAKFVDRYSADQIEQMRSQLSSATGIMQRINELTNMQNVDVAQVNQLVLQLFGNVGNIERQVRGNTSAQREFNSFVKQGSTFMSGLSGFLRSMLSMYMGYAGVMRAISGIKSAINLSDTLTSTTARLNMMNANAHAAAQAQRAINADLQTTEQLQQMIFQSAQRSRASYQNTADVVAKLGIRAKDTFSSNKETIQFAENLNKLFVISGTSQQEIASASLQLTQALGSGVLRGEEFRAVFEAAPNVMQTIADAIGKPVGALKDLASDGQITADIVKNALLGATEKINAEFESMPMTFEQVWQSFQNTALMSFQPVLDKLNDLANSPLMSNFIDNISESVVNLANVINENWDGVQSIINGFMGAFAGVVKFLEVTITLVVKAASAFNKLGNEANTISDIGVKLGFVISAVITLTAVVNTAKNAFNSFMKLGIVGKIIVIVGLIYAACEVIAKVTGAAQTGLGVICGALNVAKEAVFNAVLWVVNVFIGLKNALGAVFENIGIAFHNMWIGMQQGWFTFVKTFMEGIEWVADKINNVLGVFGLEIDTSGISQQIDNYANKINALEGGKKSYVNVGNAFDKGFHTYNVFDGDWAGDAFKAGAEWGDNAAKSISDRFNELFSFGGDNEHGGKKGKSITDNLLGDDILGDDLLRGVENSLNSISGDTSNISDNVSISEDNLKFMRDIAEREAINRYTYSNYIDMSGMNNNINGYNDIDGFVNEFTEAIMEDRAIMAEGVHN